MRPLRDNRNVYQIWKKYKDGGAGGLVIFVAETTRYLLRCRAHAWDYIRSICADGYIAEIDSERYPGIRMYLPDFRTDLIQKLIVRNQSFFEEEELSILKDNWIPDSAVICDCGAHIGNHSVFFAKVCNAAYVYAFEPEPHSFSILKENIELNELSDKVSLFNAALGDSEGSAAIALHDDSNTGKTRIVPDVSGHLKRLRLDDALSPDVKTDFIKIDVEGSELALLKGARRVITESRPVIFIETFPENRAAVFDLLNDYGYELIEDFGNDNYLFDQK